MYLYKSISKTVEAIQWLGETKKEAEEFCNKYNIPHKGVGYIKGKFGIIIKTNKGLTAASKGDFIVKTATGSYEVFSRTEFDNNFYRS